MCNFSILKTIKTWDILQFSLWNYTIFMLISQYVLKTIFNHFIIYAKRTPIIGVPFAFNKLFYYLWQILQPLAKCFHTQFRQTMLYNTFSKDFHIFPLYCTSLFLLV